MTSLQYYSVLTTLQQGLDQLTDYTPICFADKRVFKFFEGLLDEYDQVWYRILNINQIPSLRKAFDIIQNKESRRSVMVPQIPFERSTLILQSECHNKSTHCDFGPSIGSGDKDKLHCHYCQ